MYTCHICETDDKDINLRRTQHGRAHQACIEKHNRKVKQLERSLEVSGMARLVRDCDVYVGDSDAVERCLREHYPKNKVTAKLVSEVMVEAQEQRDHEHNKWLFKMIYDTVKCWPAVPDETLIEEIVEELRDAPSKKAALYAVQILAEQVRPRGCTTEFEEYIYDEDEV